MDSLELLRTHYDDQREPDAGRIDAMRHRLHARIDLEARPRSDRTAFTRRRALMTAGIGLATVSACTLLATGLPGAQPASASELLQRAAQQVATSSLAAPGSVTRIREQSPDTTYGDGGTGAPQVVATRELVTLIRIPHPGEPWQRKRWESAYDYAYGDRSKLPENMAVSDPTGRTGAAFERSDRGGFNSGARVDPRDLTLGESFAGIRDLPRDPDALLRALRADGEGPGAGSAQQVLRSAARVLGRGVASGDLQAAMFTALQKVPGLTVLDQRATDIDGRVGVAIGVRPDVPDPTGSDSVVQLIIDPATGHYLGSRFVTSRQVGLIPEGAQIGADALQTDVATTQDTWPPAGSDRWSVYP